MTIDPESLLAIFGDDMQRADASRTSKGDVSSMERALDGPGGPFDDMIPAAISDAQGNEEPARLSPGEFVLPQPLTEFMGDGDVDIGAFRLNILKENPEAAEKVKSVLREYE